ncbi:meiosis-specific protein PAIR3 isoform X2 [Aegilops tauschii subsp. strangulata]|nr:meiosis-specific protein PAIR3 isoform X2 [Aegilops tauschii subsp. strangulata]
MTEIKLPNIQKATSSDHWSLASNQYPSGKFPKVSIGILHTRSSSAAAAAAPAFERNLSQRTDGRSRPPKADNASLRVSQEAANHGGSATEAPEAAHVRVSLSQPDDHAREQTGTFSFGTRKEQGSQLDQLQKTSFVNSQGKRQVESADKTKSNSEVLRMKLRGILGTSQTKQAVASPNPEDIETPDQPKSLATNGPSSGIKKVYTSRFPDIIKTPDLLNCQTATYAKSKPSSDPIESDSDTPQVVEVRPVTRTLGRKKAPAASKKQDKNQSAKKPLSTSRSAPKQKTLDNVFVFDEKCTPKTVGKSANGNSRCLRNLRSSNRKAKVELKKVHCSDKISDKITQDAREGQLSSRNAASENKGEKTTSFSSLSRTGKTAESHSRSPTREKRLNGMAKVGLQKMQLSEKLLPTTLNEGEDKVSSQNISSKSKENYSSLLHQKENSNLSKASDRSPQAHKPAGNTFNLPPSGAASPSPEPKMYPWGNEASPQINGKPSGAASPSPEPKMYPWDNEASPQINGKPSGAASPSPEAKKYLWENEASPQINGKLGEKFASPLADRFRDMGDDFASPTFATNVNGYHTRSKVLHDDTYSPKYPKSVNRSRSSSFASDPGSEPLDGMDKTYELPKSESPNSSEERENKKQPYLSPILPTEDEMAQTSIPSFGKGYRTRKWLSDVDSPDKSPPENLDRKSHLKEGTQETIMSDKEPVQCPDDYLNRAFDELLLVLGRFQTKIKSETRNRSSEILAGTGEIIRQHLEGVEVQMQDDVDKLVNAGKSKRKRLNSTFEEQQEQLRVLHEKFKEEVNQQLLGCKNSLEEFEAYHAELKAVAEKQKASHKKLLQHAESRVGSQLNDAEIKIAKVQKRARKKMNGLKHVLKELITDTAD